TPLPQPGRSPDVAGGAPLLRTLGTEPAQSPDGDLHGRGLARLRDRRRRELHHRRRRAAAAGITHLRATDHSPAVGRVEGGPVLLPDPQRAWAADPAPAVLLRVRQRLGPQILPDL